MKTILIIIVWLYNLPVSAQHKIAITDFRTVEGKWKGTLTYLDYTSHQSVTIPANTLVEIVSDSSFDQYVYYTEEPDKNKKSRYVIKDNGRLLEEKRLTERYLLPDGQLKMVLESKGPDGNDHRPATFRHIMLLSANRFSITKLVRFDGEAEFFQRHQYSFSR
jgi:hypothetical protein